MFEFTVLQLGVLAAVLCAGVGIGWLLRSDRCAREKIAANAGWQEQLEERQAENDRLSSRIEDLERQLDDSNAKVLRLKKQVGSWRARLPRLVERYREREREVQALGAELEDATSRLAALQASGEADDGPMRPADDRNGGARSWQGRERADPD